MWLTLDINFVDLSVTAEPKYHTAIEHIKPKDTTSGHPETHGNFQTPSGKRYHVGIRGGPVSEVEFRHENPSPTSNPGYHRYYGVTGAGGPETPHIFRSVLATMRAHAKSDPSVKHFTFSSGPEEHSRAKLYRAFAKRLDPEYKEHGRPNVNGVIFTMKADPFKSEA